jgi:hypothetical protein
MPRGLLPARRQAEGRTYRLRLGEAGGHIDRGAKSQRDYWSDARRRHQPAANLIVAHNLKQLAVKHAELLAQDLAGNQQRFDDGGQKRERSGLQSAFDELIDKGAIITGEWLAVCVRRWASSSSDRGLVDPQSASLAPGPSMIFADARSLPQDSRSSRKNWWVVVA